MSFGDILLINLVNARNLKAADLNGKSDPYVIFLVGDQSAKSSVIKKTLDPEWNEMFAFIVKKKSNFNQMIENTSSLPSTKKTTKKKKNFISKLHKRKKTQSIGQNDGILSILAYDHDFLSPDDPLGSIEIFIDDIPRDTVIEKYFPLGGVDKGEIFLSIRRSPLTSPHLARIVDDLCSLERPLTYKDLEEHAISMQMLVGDEPFNLSSIEENDTNPAILNLSRLISQDNFRMESESTAEKVLKILESQKVVLTNDRPSRHLWMSGLNMKEAVLLEKCTSISNNVVKRLLFIPGDVFSSAYVSFGTPESAVACLLHFFLQKFPNIKIGFGRPIKPESSEAQCLLSGFLLVDQGTPLNERAPIGEASPALTRENVSWKMHWVVLTVCGTALYFRLYQKLQDEEPNIAVSFQNCLMLKTGPWTIELVDKESKMSYKLRALSSEDLDGWYQAYREARESLFEDEYEGEDLDLRSSLLCRHEKARESVTCRICDKEVQLFYSYSLTNSATSSEKQFSCVSCHAARIMQKINSSEFSEVMSSFSIQDIQDILSYEDFQSYLDASLTSLVSDDKLFVRCPKCQISVEIRTGESSDLMGCQLIGLDNKPLRPHAVKHYLSNRIRCRTENCHTDFCASCLCSPYHTGLNCAEYIEFLSAPKCRFCKSPVTSLNRAVNDNPAFENICSDRECQYKILLSCDRELSCGHFCYGFKGESVCPPCLEQECLERPAGSAAHDDACTICRSEDLSQAPYLVLSCGHPFHKKCIETKLKKGHPGARINFDFARCPLCKAAINHVDLAELLKPIRELEDEITIKAMERLKFEGLEKNPEIIEKGGQFFEDPEGFAMDRFSFYRCYDCKNPYFAGARVCGAAGDEEDHPDDDPKELVCNKCSRTSIQSCPKHGDAWIAHKCRFCCSIASYSCWGNCHFCPNCHTPGTWNKLVKHRTGENIKQIEEYAQCPGIRVKIDEWKSLNPNATLKEKNDAFVNIRADPARCPLKFRHPPNGFEFGLGCMMCADSSVDEVSMKANKKAEEQDAKARAEMELHWSNVKNCTLFNYSSDFDENGIIYFIGSCGKTKPWINPGLRSMKIVSVKSCELVRDSEPAFSWIGRGTVRCATRNLMNSWFSVDFIKKFIRPTHYSLRHYSSWDTEALRFWVFEGSNDENSWTIISQHQSDTSLKKRGATHTWKVNCSNAFRIFRIRLTGYNSNNHFHLCCSGFEIYGEVLDSVEIRRPSAPPIYSLKESENEDFVPKDFTYQYDFDTNGICYYLGTNHGTSSWRNPMELEMLKVEPSSLMHNSEPPSAVVGREVVRCVTQNKPNSFFIIDFQSFSIIPTAYTIRHYLSWNVEALRSWVFEGSTNKRDWVVLKKHINDTTISVIGQPYTIKLTEINPSQAFRYFCIRMTGPNSNNHNYLALSGFEIYGKLLRLNSINEDSIQQKNVVLKPIAQPKRQSVSNLQSRQFKFGYDFDKNGILYWLGTAMGAIDWINPASIDSVRVSSSALMGDSHSIIAFTGRDTVRLCSKPVMNSWFAVDFFDKYVTPTHYSLKHYSSWDVEALRSWVLEASNDGSNFVILMRHSNDTHLYKRGGTHTWRITPPVSEKYRIFRIRLTAKNSNNHLYLCCSGIEFYGTLYY